MNNIVIFTIPSVNSKNYTFLVIMVRTYMMELKWQTRVIVKNYLFYYLFIRSIVVMEINIYLLWYLLNVTLYVFCKSTCPLNALNRRNFDSCASTRSRKRRNRSPSAAAAAPRASCAFRNRSLCSLAANNYLVGIKL